MTPTAPIIRSLADVPGCALSPGGAEHLGEVARDAGSSVFLEIWEPGCAQPLGAAGRSAEVLVILAGQAEAMVDGAVQVLAAGDVVLLGCGSSHRVVNTSSQERLYTLVVSARDDELADRVRTGALASVSGSTDAHR